MNIKTYLRKKRKLIETTLDNYMPRADAWPVAIHEAMRYSVFAGGKRIRPVLCLAANAAVGGNENDALIPAIAIEVFHTYTLIHDDLPAMDNDDLRRGKPTAHKAFGEANAILAGDALMTLAFEWLALTQAPPPYPPNQLSLELAKAGGSQGVIGGQAEDLAAEQQAPSARLVEYIHLHKTADLFKAAARMGAISGKANQASLDALSEYGAKLGLAFQIADDILDETADSAKLGKSPGKDKAQDKMTYVKVHGMKKSVTRAKKLYRESISALKKLKGDTEPLAAIAEFSINI